MKRGITFVFYLGMTNWGIVLSRGYWRLDAKLVTIQVCFYDLDYRYKLILIALQDMLIRYGISPDRYISNLFKKK